MAKGSRDGSPRTAAGSHRDPPPRGEQQPSLGSEALDEGGGRHPRFAADVGERRGLVLVSTWGSESPSGPSFQEFLKSDSNRDGRLSRDEVKEFDEFGAVDTDGDGFIYEREWDELRKMGVGDYGMIAVRLGGRGDLTDTGVVWRDRRNYSTLPTSLIYKGVLYVPKGRGIIASLDPQTGQLFKIDRTKEALGDSYASPVAADDKVYFVSDSGKVTVIKAGRQWEILAVNDLGEETYATPAIAGRRLFIRTRQALYCFGAKPEQTRHAVGFTR